MLSNSRQTIELLNTALQQYHQFWGKFPTDCNDCSSDPEFENEVNADIQQGDPNGLHYGNYSMMLSLRKTPASRKIVDKISAKLLTAKDDNVAITVESPTSSGKFYDLFMVLDGWNEPFYYRFSDVNDSFPLIESAGEDKDFSTVEDNITNR